MTGTAALAVTVNSYRGAVVVRPVGVLDMSTYATFRDTLLKLAVDVPPAIVVDLGDLEIPSPLSLAVFSSVRTRIATWPGVPVLLVAADPARRAALADAQPARYGPVYADVPAALRGIGQPPRRRHATRSLPAGAISSYLAREFVRHTCRRWGLAGLSQDATAIASELVENVAQHTSSAARLCLELRRRRFTVSVADHDPRPATLRESVGHPLPNPGLAIVARLARAWGCVPTGDGKVVWATLTVG